MGISPGGGTYEAGIGCVQCGAVLFGGSTPKYIEANVLNVITCPGRPNFVNGAYLLTQTGVACRWEYVDGLWRIGLSFEAGGSNFAIVNFLSPYFNDPSIIACRDTFTNQRPITCLGGSGGHSGTADIFWGPGIGI